MLFCKMVKFFSPQIWKCGLTKVSWAILWFNSQGSFSNVGTGRNEWVQQLSSSGTSEIYFKLTHFAGGSDSKASAYTVGDLGSIPGSGRSPGEEMATHSRILTWKIPRTEEPGGLQGVAELDRTELLHFHFLSHSKYHQLADYLIWGWDDKK